MTNEIIEKVAEAIWKSMSRDPEYTPDFYKLPDGQKRDLCKYSQAAITAYESELKAENEALLQNQESMQQTNQALIKKLEVVQVENEKLKAQIKELEQKIDGMSYAFSA